MTHSKENSAEQQQRLELLREEVKKFPTLPGVYLMKDLTGTVIYIGKAKSLRNRVKSYFAGGDGRAQITFLLKRIWQIENIVTASEEQAFVLERDLINKHKPRYNIRLKDDKAYLSIRLDENARWPRLELVRRVTQDGALYYGPYSFSYEVRGLLEIINRVIPLRSCADTVLYNRQRPCLEYQIKRCAAPCCLPVDQQEYSAWVDQAKQILEGNVDTLVDRFSELMDHAAEKLEFERAAELRDKIDLLKHFGKSQEYISPGAENRDVFALYREEQLATLSVLTVRNGRIADNKNYSFQEVQVSNGELMSNAIEQYYRNQREVPSEVVVSVEPDDLNLLKNELTKRRGLKAEIINPRRGIKFRLIKLAEVNATQHFSARFDLEARYQQMAEALAKIAQLEQVPRRVECVDISNFQGSEIVGAVVSFFDGQPEKRYYKKYILKNQGKPDDFLSMHEVLSRRLSRGQREGQLPDLIVIDGGKGQLGAALRARDELELKLDIISIAKERAGVSKGRKVKSAVPERIFLEGNSDSIPLEASSEPTKFLTRIRDEVHRTVITFHRNRRHKSGMKSVLDEISGVGPERKRRLLKEFGTISKIKTASVKELAKAGRMPASLAEKILDKLN